MMMSLSRHRARSFTLIELLVVVTLMTVTVGLAVTRLDGLSETARLRSGAAQYSAILKLALSESRASGQPRQIRFSSDSSSISVHRPERKGNSWEWDAGVEYSTNAAQIDRLLVEGTDSPQASLRVHPGGKVPNHAVVLRVAQRFALFWYEGFAVERFVLCDRGPAALSYDVLRTELEIIGAR